MFRTNRLSRHAAQPQHFLRAEPAIDMNKEPRHFLEREHTA